MYCNMTDDEEMVEKPVFSSQKKNTDQDSGVDMIDYDTSNNNTVMVHENDDISQNSQPLSVQEITNMSTDSRQPHDDAPPYYLNQNQDQNSYTAVHTLSSRFPLVQNPALTTKQQINDMRQDSHTQSASHRQPSQIPTLVIPKPTSASAPFQNLFQSYRGSSGQSTSILRLVTPTLPTTMGNEPLSLNTLIKPQPASTRPTLAPRSASTTSNVTMTKPQPVVTSQTPRPVLTSSSGMLTKPQPVVSAHAPRPVLTSSSGMLIKPQSVVSAPAPRPVLTSSSGMLTKPQPFVTSQPPRPVLTSSSGMLTKQQSFVTSQAPRPVLTSSSGMLSKPQGTSTQVPSRLFTVSSGLTVPSSGFPTSTTGVQAATATSEFLSKVPFPGNQSRFPSHASSQLPITDTQNNSVPRSQLTNRPPVPRFFTPTLPNFSSNYQPVTPSPLVAPIQKEVRNEYDYQEVTNLASKSPTPRKKSGDEDENIHEYPLPKTPKKSVKTNPDSKSPFDLQKQLARIELLKKKSPGGPVFTSRPMFECEAKKMDTHQSIEPGPFLQTFCKEQSNDSNGQTSANIFGKSSPVPGTTLFSSSKEQNRDYEMQPIESSSMSFFDNNQSSHQEKGTFENSFFSMFDHEPASPQHEETSFSFGFGGQETSPEPQQEFSFSFGGSSNNDNSSSVLSLF